MAHLLHSKPLNTLKRAEELVLVGKKDTALRSLYDLLSYKRNRVWSKEHEILMLRYLELCIEQRSSRYAKEGLHQFRSLSIYNASSSLEKVVRYYIDKSTEQVELAAKEVKMKSLKTLDSVEDLEIEKNPEELLIEALSSSSTENQERKILVPWLKFLWESFRAVVELLRHQPKLELLYHEIARRAIKFCGDYGRRTELKRMADILRKHLRTSEVEVINEDNIGLHLETRFLQLEVSSSLRVWIEGFRTIEDIHQVMNASKKKISSKVLGVYYQKLTQLFLVSDNFLFHAYAYKKYFKLNKEKNKSITEDEIKLLASCVLLAALSIPLEDSKAGRTTSQQKIILERNSKLARLLNFDVNPQRDSILNDISADKVIYNSVFPEFREMFVLLERSMDVESSWEEVNKLVEATKASFVIIKDTHSDHMEKYVESIQKLLTIRVIQSLSTFNSTISFEKLRSLFKDFDISAHRIEDVIVQAIKARQVGENNLVKLDHREKMIVFQTNLAQYNARTNYLITLFTKAKNGIHSVSRNKISMQGIDVRAEAIRECKLKQKRKSQVEQRNKRVKEMTLNQKTEEESARLKRKKEAEERRIQHRKELEEKREREKQTALEKQERILNRKAQLLQNGVSKQAVLALDAEKLGAMSDEDVLGLIEKSQKKKLEKENALQKKFLKEMRVKHASVRLSRERAWEKVNKTIATRKQRKLKRTNDAMLREAENAKQRYETAQEAGLMLKNDDYLNLEKEFLDPLVIAWQAAEKKMREEKIEQLIYQQKMEKLTRARERLAEAKKQEEILRLKRERERKRLEEEQKRKQQEDEMKAKEEMFRQAKAPEPTFTGSAAAPVAAAEKKEEDGGAWRRVERSSKPVEPKRNVYRPKLQAYQPKQPVDSRPNAGEVYRPKEVTRAPEFARGTANKQNRDEEKPAERRVPRANPWGRRN
eukprot:augustus_masked-scaffold_2-processed-gene-5.48-mRNA-1 protein AED:0.46 eAED:0.46 QI:0/-1/0/1/-1/1/1/0/936